MVAEERSIQTFVVVVVIDKSNSIRIRKFCGGGGND
jgi:hypothetical protein